MPAPRKLVLSRNRDVRFVQEYVNRVFGGNLRRAARTLRLNYDMLYRSTRPTAPKANGAVVMAVTKHMWREPIGL